MKLIQHWFIIVRGVIYYLSQLILLLLICVFPLYICLSVCYKLVLIPRYIFNNTFPIMNTSLEYIMYVHTTVYMEILIHHIYIYQQLKGLGLPLKNRRKKFRKNIEKKVSNFFSLITPMSVHKKISAQSVHSLAGYRQRKYIYIFECLVLTLLSVCKTFSIVVLWL